MFDPTVINSTVAGASPFSDLLNVIALQYLPSIYCFCFVLNERSDSLVLEAQFSAPFISVNLETVTESIQMDNLERGCQTYILSQNSAIQFLGGYQRLQDFTNQRFPNKAFIVAMNRGAEREQLQTIVECPIVRDIPRLLLLVPSAANDNVEVWTNKYSRPSGHSQLIPLDTYFLANRSFRHGVDLFPDKMIDLEGRFVRLALINYKPFTTWMEVDDVNKANAYVGNDKKLMLDGTETRVLLEFCRIHNCSLDVSLEEADQWGEVYEDHTGTGIVGAISAHRVDVGVGAMLAWFYESNSPSQSVSRTGVTCITPKQRLLPSWMTPILPFTKQVWTIVCVTFIASSISLLFLNHMSNNVIRLSETRLDVSEVITSVGSSLILGSVQRIEQYKVGSQATVISVLLFAGLIIGNSYCGGLSSVMTVPQYEQPIDTPRGLAERDLIWGASHDAWVYALVDSDEPIIRKLVSNFRTMNKTALLEHAKIADMGYAIERLPYGHYGISSYITNDAVHNFRVMQEDLYWGHCVVQVTKTWPMLEPLNGVIMRVFQSGIQRYWEEVVLAQFPETYNVQRIVGLSRVHDNPGAVALQVHHLSGPLFLLMFGLACGFVVFLAEIAWFKVSRYRRINKTRNYSLE